SLGETLPGRFLVPAHSFEIVFARALAEHVHGRDAVLRLRIALAGCLAEPGERLAVAFFDAAAVLVHESEIELRQDVSLLGRLAVPHRGLLVVAFHAALPGIVEKRHAELSLAVAALDERL